MRNMKDSGISWIGSIPSNWNVQKVKTAFYRSKKEAHVDDPVILSLARSGVKIRDISNNEGQLAESYYNYNPVVPGDLLLNPMDLYSGANCSISKVSGVISPAYINLRTRGNYCSTYYDYYFKTQYWSMALFAHGKGVSFDNRWTLSPNDLFNYYIPIPDYDEQKKIADFLDHKCSEIDAVIEKTKATIEEYKSLKQSIITDAVTKGIRGSRPMKDSSIKWIGEIPVDWDVLRLKNLAINFSKGNGITKEDIAVDGDTPCVRYGEIYTKYNQSFTKCKTRTNKVNINAPKYFSYGDILFTCTGELIEEIGKSITYLGKDKCLAGGDIVILRHTQNPKFLNYAINSTYAQAQKSCNKTKLKVVHISASDIANMILAVPNIIEQREIAEYLDKICTTIDDVITKKIVLITEMEKYKKSVIYEYVTGKKEVV